MLTVPTDSVSSLVNSSATPDMCGERQVITIWDMDDGTIGPAYLTTANGATIWDKTLLVQATGQVDIGMHNVRLT